MPALRIRTPGLHTTLQDRGRPAFQHLGVPISGALDPIGLHLANALAGNPPGMAALEICVAGPEIEAVDGPVRLAIAGGPCRPILAAGRSIAGWRSVTLAAGETLRIGAVAVAACAYVAVAGGFDLPPLLGSLSTSARAGLGGLDGRVLRAGDLLPLRGAAIAGPDRALRREPDYGDGPIRVVLGPQDDHFAPESLADFLSAPFTVSREADRMGLRLDGPLLRHALTYDIPSDGIVTGAIQVPGSGRAIILLPEHQTTGGYAKIATVISADLPRVGRMIPGQTLRFAAVTVEEAEAIARDRAARIAALAADLVPAIEPGRIDPDRLGDHNLISGVVNALE